MMEFLVELIITVIKMFAIGGVGFGGIMLGKHLRKKKTAKQAAEAANN